MLGKLIAFEGIEGSGKSTQAELLTEYLTGLGAVVKLAREPGGTALGERVRELVLDPGPASPSPRAELFLYLAARAQLVRELIKPALEAGEWVILDRYVHSTIAYQGYGQRVDLAGPYHAENIAYLTELCRRGSGGFWPDLVLLLDLPAETGLARLKGQPDRIERRDTAFHGRVREGYLELAAAEPGIFRTLDATKTPEDVAEEVKKTLAALPDFEASMGRR